MQTVNKSSEGNEAVSPNAKRARMLGILMPGIIFAAFVLLYWLTPTHYYTFDAVSYANAMAHGYPRTHNLRLLFHPHHLLFNATGYVIWRLVRECGYRGGPLVVMERFNAIVGAIGVMFYYMTLRRLLQRSNSLPVLMTVGLGLSFGYWICATDGRVNAASTTLLLAAFYLLCRLREAATIRLALAAGACAGLAVLYHESAGLFVGVGLVGIASLPSDVVEQSLRPLSPSGERSVAHTPTGKEPDKRNGRLRLAIAFTAAWLAIAGTGYAMAALVALRLHSAAAVHQWSAEYSDLGWWWNFDIARDIRLHLYALRHAAFVEPVGKQGTFHIAVDTPTGILALYWSTLVGWFVGVYYFIVALPLLWRTHHHRTILFMSLVWIALYAAFFTVWTPSYFVFWVPALAPIGLMMALGLAHFRSQRGGVVVNWLVGMWISMFVTINVIENIGPHLHSLASPYERIALEYRSHTRPGDLVVIPGVGDLSELEPNMEYFGDRDCISDHEELTRNGDNPAQTIAAMRAQIAATIASGHAVYVSDDLWRAYRYPEIDTALRVRHQEVGVYALHPVFAHYTASVAWYGSHGGVWRLTPKDGVKQANARPNS